MTTTTSAEGRYCSKHVEWQQSCGVAAVMWSGSKHVEWQQSCGVAAYVWSGRVAVSARRLPLLRPHGAPTCRRGLHCCITTVQQRARRVQPDLLGTHTDTHTHNFMVSMHARTRAHTHTPPPQRGGSARRTCSWCVTSTRVRRASRPHTHSSNRWRPTCASTALSGSSRR